MLELQKDAYEISTFMEIKLNGKWYLLDPNKCFLYDAYNYESNVLPLGYYAYVKGVNKNDLNAKSSKYIKSIEDFFGNFYNFQDDYNGNKWKDNIQEENAFTTNIDNMTRRM